MVYITKEDVYRVSGLPSDGSVISDVDVLMFIDAAESLIEKKLGTTFQPDGLSVTEIYDGTGTNTLFLRHYPIKSLTSVTIDSTSVTTSNLYVYNHTGKLVLKSNAEVTTWKNTYPQLCTVVYVYGEEPDERVRQYTAIVAAMMTLIAQIGGTFDDVTSFSLPHMTGSLGEPYTNIREALARLEKQEMMMRDFVRIKPQFG